MMKPCPFCGGEKIRDRFIRDGRQVYCADCSASVTAFQPNATESAKSIWNCRPSETTGDLPARMKAAGMISVAEMIAGNTPLERWIAHTSVRDMDSFQEWLVRRYREFVTMQARYDLGDKPKDDELYEWVISHAGAFGEVMANFRAALKAEGESR